MEKTDKYFKEVLNDVVNYASKLGFNVVIKTDIDEFFKGDLDGLNIYLRQIDYEEDLFNILHMVGHSIQWNVSDDLRKLGNVIYVNPSNEVLNKLQNYEWEANCYGYKILVELGHPKLKTWLEAKYVLDMLYLTHFYKTGEKLRVINEETLKNAYKKPLIAKEIPMFKPRTQKNTRNGIVIDFNV
jgi:hypothetical protein